MNYKDYQFSRNAAWRLLIDCGITELPIKPTRICRQLGIPVRIGTPPKGSDGCAIVVNGEPVIILSGEPAVTRQRFSAAHELGHILLGHLGHVDLVNREPSPQDSPIEQAANVFASRLLAPACVLWGCGVASVEEIGALCDIGPQAAAFRWQRMQELNRRNKFLLHPLERQVYAQFQAYIETHRLRDRPAPPEVGQ